MITPEQLVAESEALVKLMNDPAYSAPEIQMVLARVLNELAWVNDGEPPPVSQILVDRQARLAAPTVYSFSTACSPVEVLSNIAARLVPNQGRTDAYQQGWDDGIGKVREAVQARYDSENKESGLDARIACVVLAFVLSDIDDTLAN